MVAPFKTLWRGADLFSILFSIMVAIRNLVALFCQHLPRRDYGSINATGSIDADQFSIGLR
jgi:hypothetical protein